MNFALTRFSPSRLWHSVTVDRSVMVKLLVSESSRDSLQSFTKSEISRGSKILPLCAKSYHRVNILPTSVLVQNVQKFMLYQNMHFLIDLM